MEQGFECGIFLQFGPEPDVFNHARIIVEFLWESPIRSLKPKSMECTTTFRKNPTYDEFRQRSDTWKVLPCFLKSGFLPGLAAPCQLYQRLSVFVVRTAKVENFSQEFVDEEGGMHVVVELDRME